jgi:DtxR family transcriptional regulator, Mn-dependent transcriptional regulator
MSSEVEEALLEELNYPQVCPHGNPLPGYENAVMDWIPLTEAKTGTTGTIRRIHEFAEGSAETLAFLEENQIAPGQVVQVEQFLPFNETVTIRVDQRLVSLGFAVAHFIYIEVD